MAVLETLQPVVRMGAEGERFAFGGAEVIFKSPLPGCEEGWAAIDYTLPAGQMGAPLHYHRELTESFYVISGELWMRVGDREFVAGPGSYTLVTPGTAHSFGNRSDRQARFLAHASDARHKTFLCELFGLIQTEKSWPPVDPAKFIELGNRFDTFYL